MAISKRKPKKRKSLTIPQLKERAWKALSLYIRRVYANRSGYCTCYTCGKAVHWRQEAQAGHAIDGRTGSVLLDIEIIRPQCSGCNIFKHGNHKVFTTKLIKEHGMEWWEEKLENSHQVKDWNRQELEEFTQGCKNAFDKLQEDWTL